MWLFDSSNNSINADFIKILTVESTRQYQELGYTENFSYAVVAIVKRDFQNEMEKHPIAFFDTKEEAVAYNIDLTFKLNGLKVRLSSED